MSWKLVCLCAATICFAQQSVVHIEKNAADAAVAKGGTLTKGSNYTVSVSRRDKPGEAEIHEKDTDIFYVLEGTATFVTGGKAAAAKSTGPGEFRGGDITGGDPRKLQKGETIVIPAGVPHWFKEVSNPFVYYVVKVR